LDYFKSFLWQFFFNSTFAVDLFFSFSGFFIAVISLKNLVAMSKATISQSMMNIVLRLLRIWPLYSLIFLGYWKFYIYAMDGPISGYTFNNELYSCDKQWPFMLTLFTNWTYGIWETAYPYCMSWYWYIPNDFQYCIVAVVFLMLYARKRNLFWALFVSFNLGMAIVEAYECWTINFGPNLLDIASNNDYYKYYYLKFYTRSGPFFIGFLFGIVYAQYKRDAKANVDSFTRRIFEQIKDSKMLSFIVWFIGFFIMMAILFATYWSYGEKWSFGFNFFYAFFGRKLYVFGLFLFCFPLMLGNLYLLGGWFAHDVFLPFAKLSFSVYIIHPLLVKYVIFNVRAPIYFNGNSIFIQGFGLVVASYLLAIPVCTLFEMPFQNVRNIFKKKVRGPAPEKKSRR